MQKEVWKGLGPILRQSEISNYPRHLLVLLVVIYHFLLAASLNIPHNSYSKNRRKKCQYVVGKV